MFSKQTRLAEEIGTDINCPKCGSLGIKHSTTERGNHFLQCRKCGAVNKVARHEYQTAVGEFRAGEVEKGFPDIKGAKI